MKRVDIVNALHVGWARSLHAVGWHGLLGLLLIAFAAGLQWQAQRTAQEARELEAAMPRIVQGVDTANHAKPSTMPPPRLPVSGDAPLLLRDIQKATQEHGLAWTSATYQFVPVTNERLATLEIQTTLKGPYLKIKKVIAALLHEQPAMAMREFAVTRPTPDASEVEAKIRWAVFLADGWNPVATGAPAP